MKKPKTNKIALILSVLAVFCFLVIILNKSHSTSASSKDTNIEQGKKDDILGKYLMVKSGMTINELTEIMGTNFSEGSNENGTKVIKYAGYAKGTGLKMNIYFEIEDGIVKESYPLGASDDNYKFTPSSTESTTSEPTKPSVSISIGSIDNHRGAVDIYVFIENNGDESLYVSPMDFTATVEGGNTYEGKLASTYSLKGIQLNSQQKTSGNIHFDLPVSLMNGGNITLNYNGINSNQPVSVSVSIPKS